MGMEDLDHLAGKLEKISYYKPLFEKAFGNPAITKENINNALSQFVSSIKTFNSRFDQQQAMNFVGFTSKELMGKDLFLSNRTNCSRCHAGVNFSAPDFPGGEYGGGGSIIGFDDHFNPKFADLKGGANNGLEATYSDPGMGNGRFRIPSLRNIALTGPYMHDGRFKTLEAVVDHYNSGIQSSPNLDNNLKNPDGTPLRPNLNVIEKQALVAFLHTLTDESLLSDPKYSDPFK
jgi:cytochrome c peroxidase